MTLENKIVSKKYLVDKIKKLKENGKRVGFTNGCFDVLHRGHVRYLEAAKSSCDVLVVGLNSDDSVRRLKGESRPVNKEDARAEVMAALAAVDYVVLFAEDTPGKLIEGISPDVLYKGGDWEEHNIIGAPHVRSYGGDVKVIPYLEGYSTTDIIHKMRG